METLNKELYEMLGIESPEEFMYFEDMAALLESEDEIEYEALAELLKAVDMPTFANLVNDYFEDITNHVPGSETEVYTILDNERMALMGMARNMDEDLMTSLVDEVVRFRKWYSVESRVYCTPVGSVGEECHSLRDALVLSRLENLDGSKYYYDFSEILDYSIGEYIMSFRDMIALSEEDEENSEGEYEEEYNDEYDIAGGDYE